MQSCAGTGQVSDISHRGGVWYSLYQSQAACLPPARGPGPSVLQARFLLQRCLQPGTWFGNKLQARSGAAWHVPCLAHVAQGVATRSAGAASVLGSRMRRTAAWRHGGAWPRAWCAWGPADHAPPPLSSSFRSSASSAWSGLSGAAVGLPSAAQRHAASRAQELLRHAAASEHVPSELHRGPASTSG
jgi:hypothetical protein